MGLHCVLIDQVVQYERGDGGEGDCGGEDTVHAKEELRLGDEKLSSLQLEYTHLLSSQLESQRQYFEDRMAELVTTVSQEVTLHL